MIKEDDFQFEYCSAKYSNFSYESVNETDGNRTYTDDKNFPEFATNNNNYMRIDLEKDSHFYDISITTNTSCVHVPTNIYYKGIISIILFLGKLILFVIH